MAEIFKREEIYKPVYIVSLCIMIINMSFLGVVFIAPENVQAITCPSIWSDGFETGFSNWNTSIGAKWSISNSGYLSSKSAKATGDTGSVDDFIYKNISTAGKNGITFSYYYKAKDLEFHDKVYAEWSANGIIWEPVLFIIDSSSDDNNWHFKSHALPAKADNKTGFTIRFRSHLNSNNDFVYIDTVAVLGCNIPVCTDNDQDGYSLEGGQCGLTDCNDSNPAIHPGATETCNGVDDDCDGATDESLGSTPTSCGLGACEAIGELVCYGGQMVDTCQAGTPGTETCNNIDDDCDGAIDENLNQETTCGLGACANNSGIEICAAGKWAGNSCDPFLGSIDEICDEQGVDEDCDGEVNEGCECLVGQTKNCGPQNDTGSCQFGLQVCIDGTWSSCSGEINPADEICDGLDNDCDGEIDENYQELGQECTVGIGKCRMAGQYICAASHDGTVCDAQAGAPDEAEICGNQIDDNCDGQVDEGCISPPSEIISGFKYNDENNNGIIDEEEPKLSGWVIELLGCPFLCEDLQQISASEQPIVGECGVIATTTTDSNGRFEFNGQIGGCLLVREVAQPHWIQTYPAGPNYYQFQLIEGQSVTNLNFANYKEKYCGDGKINADGEQCDDGNFVDGDGCSANCTIEQRTCNPNAYRQYTTDADFDLGALDGVEHVSVHDQLQTIPGNVTTYPILWIANAGEDTISKWDTNTNRELARYATWFGAPSNHSAWSNAAPSRTAVDVSGNCYVANRHFESNPQRPADVIKILTDDWIDRDGDGAIDTSFDLNGDGAISADEMLPLTDLNGNGRIDPEEIIDERIAWVSTVGPAYGLGRSLAIDLNGNVWLGLYNARQYYKLSSSDGSILDGPVDVSPHTPYGALVDKNGILWGASLSNNLLKLNTNTNAIEIFNSDYSNYGIALGYDAEGYTQVYLGYGTPYTQFDSKTNAFSSPVSAGFYSLGLAVDAGGNILAGNAYTGGVTKYSPNGALIWDGTPQVYSEARGVVVDSSNDVWVIHVNTNQMSKFKGSDGTGLGVFNTGLHPYTYSDASGLGLRSSLISGKWTVAKDSGLDATIWEKVSWNSLVPDGASLTVRARSSSDQINWSPWVTVSNGESLSTIPNGRYLQVEVGMQATAGYPSPILYDLTIGTPCEAPQPAPTCGDGVCGNDENCQNCQDDCGRCLPTGGGSSLCILLGTCGGAHGFLTSDQTQVLGEAGAPALSITKTASHKAANKGQEILYTIEVQNAGNVTAYNVKISDLLPAGLNFKDWQGNSKDWSVGDIPPGGVQKIEYYVSVADSAEAKSYVNTALASADNSPEVSANAPVEIKDVVVLGAELAGTGFSPSELAALAILASILYWFYLKAKNEYEAGL